MSIPRSLRYPAAAQAEARCQRLGQRARQSLSGPSESRIRSAPRAAAPSAPPRLRPLCTPDSSGSRVVGEEPFQHLITTTDVSLAAEDLDFDRAVSKELHFPALGRTGGHLDHHRIPE